MLVETVHKANFLAAEAAEDLVISVRALWPLVAAAYGIAAFAFLDFFAIACASPLFARYQRANGKNAATEIGYCRAQDRLLDLFVVRR
jgi:hypothetical protein